MHNTVLAESNLSPSLPLEMTFEEANSVGAESLEASEYGEVSGILVAVLALSLLGLVVGAVFCGRSYDFNPRLLPQVFRERVLGIKVTDSVEIVQTPPPPQLRAKPNQLFDPAPSVHSSEGPLSSKELESSSASGKRPKPFFAGLTKSRRLKPASKGEVLDHYMNQSSNRKSFKHLEAEFSAKEDRARELLEGRNNAVVVGHYTTSAVSSAPPNSAPPTRQSKRQSYESNKMNNPLADVSQTASDHVEV